MAGGFQIFCFQNSFQLAFFVSLTLRYSIARGQSSIPTSRITTISQQKSSSNYLIDNIVALRKNRIADAIAVTESNPEN